ncbi:hypothetical protein DPEC_G00236710 [Dallia pectoralis]|uniref:Uncharacterized protein n=1 Tax=Dallia pectoralis TaxID=75939 RepID=A0ACC2FYE8_DALPE|nr:hypothetical protein DPEC_G00236710 [Dallia pectoralis]
MGSTVSVRNQTPYTWHYEVIGEGGRGGTLQGWQSAQIYLTVRWIKNYLNVRYDTHSWNSFSYEFNSHKGDGSQTFTIIENSDRSFIQLQCSTEDNSPVCPNYGKQEEDRIRQQQEEMERRRQEEQRRREQEERRRQEQLERERRIQQEIERESELSGKKVSKGQEKLREKLSLRAAQFNHQRTQVLHQMIEDDAAAVRRDELAEIKNNFEELLKKYEISEHKQDNTLEEKLENRMKSLQNELTLQYFEEPQQALWCQLRIDTAISEGEHSLTERFSILTAVAELTLTNNSESEKVNQPDVDKNYDFFIRLLELLYGTNPTLAQQLVLSILTMFPEVSEKNKWLLSQILFNMIWTPSEILLFLQGVVGKDQELATSILHTVRTNKLDLLSTLSALKENEPVKYLQWYAEAEMDKDANTIVDEMRNAKYPDKLVSIMEEILGFMTEELPKHAKVDLNQETIDETKQMIKLLDLTNPDLEVLKLTTGEKGILLEIGTGEGKSCILAMFATIQAIRGINIDIVTSSPVLARRDQEEWQKLYNLFGVTSSVVPPPQIQGSSPESRDSMLQEAYKKQLVYGTVGTFAADALRQEFEKDTTRGERKFDMVIVDEVDYMTLDNGVQCDLLTILENALENTVAIDCYAVNNNKAVLVEKKTLDHTPDILDIKMLLLENGRASEIIPEGKLIKATVSELMSKIKYSHDSELKSDFLVIPSFLEKFLEDRLPAFVQNALKAIMMTQGREYMIDQALENVIDTHLYHAIIPVDFKASGVLEKNKRWGDGLQQFLEMKHQLAITPLSNVTNYLSNFHYFKRYLKGNGLFGVSGTLGGDADKDFLARHYKTNSYTIPAHRHKKVVELPAIQVSGKDQWMEILCKTAWRVADGGQVVLVVCEDVKTANELQNKMERDNPQTPITLYTISEKHNIESTKFIGGHIIIATNLGGRGTDIKVDKDVNLCGGLFVLLTHYPSSRRVEKQVFGRTGRKGNPGMVQMIVCEDTLAPAYQGQPVEIMRQIREEYEVKRIKDMETDELLEINMKEDLFETFCTFLEQFDSKFTKEEKEDLSGMNQNNVPECFKDRSTKFDYQPALNALKETWSLWLTLHEEHINRHEDISVLKEDLLKNITNRSNMLLDGKSHTFYDHIKQAIGRTDLHCRNKNNCDYGAKSYWKDVEDCDPFYSAVALYNQAFITINMAKEDYKTEAHDLMVKAKTKIDVYLSETTNTMVSFQMATRGNFEPHHEGERNFLKQMDSRMSIYKAWMNNISLAINKLEELKDKGTAITEESSVFSLSDNKDYITANELTAFYENGLFIVFEVKKKPEFCFDALICFFIGMCQVVIGVLICALSFGSATNIGFSFISEGVSDMIEGITGMITGTFDWVSWAISKSISIGMSLLSAGFSIIKKVAKSAYLATKGLLNGTKTLSSVAKDVIGAGKHAFKSIKGAVSSLTKGAVRSSTASIKTAFKQATKYAVQEVAKQGINTALNYAIDTGIQAVFKEILKDAFKDSVSSTVKNNAKLCVSLTEYIASALPKGALENSTSYKIDSKLEQQMKDLVQIMTKDLIPQLMNNDTTSKVGEVISRLTEVSKTGLELVEKSGGEKLAKGIKISLKIAEYTTILAKMVQSIPTEHVINDIFIVNLIKTIENQQQDMGKYDQDGRHNLPDVISLKNEFLISISESVSEAFIDACSGHMTSFVNGYVKNKFNGATGKMVDNVLGRYKTEAFFKDLQHNYDMKTASKTTGKTLSETETKELLDYAEKIGDVNRPATVLDIYVLTNSDLLQGKGIRLTVVDQQGKTLSEETYPGTNSTAGQITLRLTKEKIFSEKDTISKVKDRIKGVQNPYSGHFDIIQDGTVIPVHSENQSSFYTAVAQATMSDKTNDELNKEAVNLRNNVKDQIKNNLPAHSQMIQTQKAYDALENNQGKYTIVGGSKTETENNVEYEKDISPMKKASYGSPGLTEYKIAKNYQLALVGPYKRMKNTSLFSNEKENRGIVVADHIPPKDSLKLARDHPQIEDLRQKNPKLYDLIDSVGSDPNGMNLVAMRVLTQHHRDALTTGTSKESDNCRKLLADTLVKGDAEKSLKLSFIISHPVASNQLQHNAGNPLSLGSNASFMSTEGTVSYYKAGFNQMLNHHSEQGYIEQNQLESLKSWVADDKYLDLNTPESTDVLKAIERKNLP